MKNLLDLVSFDFNSFIGRELGNITILKELGRGNKGVVFIAFQKSLKRQVAVKILPKMCASTEEQRQQFRDEAEIIAILSHPNIITIFEMGEEEEFYFQVMQLINGSDLEKIIADHYKHPVAAKRLIPLDQTINVIIQVLDGLAYAHDEDIIHQDIKASNILIEERTKRPLLADFGIAKTSHLEYHLKQGIIIGSPTYMSPEQASGRETDRRTDIYSLGILLLKMLTGVLPVRKENVEEILVRKINEPETFIDKLPSEASPLIKKDLEKIVLKAIEPDVEKRYQDCYSFKDDLTLFRDKYLS